MRVTNLKGTNFTFLISKCSAKLRPHRWLSLAVAWLLGFGFQSVGDLGFLDGLKSTGAKISGCQEAGRHVAKLR